MRLRVIIFLILTAAVLSSWLWRGSGGQKLLPQVLKLEPEDYSAIAADLKTKIDNISPTPPTEPDWTVTGIEFAKDTNLAYITYSDTHNVFRILVEIRKQEDGYRYSVKATFEMTDKGWVKKFGEDSVANKPLIKVE